MSMTFGKLDQENIPLNPMRLEDMMSITNVST